RPAAARLLERRADASADASSIGTGRPHIAGTPVSTLLSALYPSDMMLAGHRCLDLRDTPCLPPPPCAATLAAEARRTAGEVLVDVTLPQACGRVHMVSASASLRGRRGRR